MKWTPPLFDSVTQTWMVSAILPLDVNHHWIGNLGRDISLKNVLLELFQYSQYYQKEQHFVLDNQGHYLYAGTWQSILEKNPSNFKPNLTLEPELNHLLQQKLSTQPQAFDQTISIKGIPYIAIGVQLQPTNWQYFRLIPVNQILAPIHQMFFWLTALIVSIGLTVGLLINLAVKQHIIKRLEALSKAVRQYGQGDLNARYDVTGDDEITQTSLEFNAMADQLQATLEAIPDLLFEMDLNGQYYAAHAPKLDILAAPIKDLLGKNVTDIAPESAARIVLSALHEAQQNNYSHGKQLSIPLAQGETWFELSVAKKSNSNLTNPRFIVLARDISDRKLALKEIEHLALYDPLTHLPNRRLLLDRLNQAVTASVRNARLGALLFLDLDQFKTLNDSFGHHIGDELLRQVAIRLKGCVREVDTVARLGGDEFVVIVEDLSVEFNTTAIQAENMAHKILNALQQPYQLSEVAHHSTCSIGITLFGAQQTSIEELLKQADIAMYQAKQAGRNTVRFFNSQMQEKITHHVAIERELRDALYQQQLTLHYQIQVDGFGNKLGAEALIRWQHPKHGLLSPAQFIPLAESSDLILSIGQWTLNAACLQLKLWENNPLTVSVNISAKQFHQAEFITQVKDILQRHKINPRYLKFELTESILLDHVESTINNMSQLKEIGISIALDDFGTGYSSLQYLKKLPIDELKIDQTFVRDIIIDPSDQAIVRTIIVMANALNLNVIAEGVETEAQKQSLLDKGCTRFQGYLFGKPMSADALEEMLKQRLIQKI
ncbi:MAG: EAL domain-containing protein [Methylotenera sp.]|nr:EAL domain-containing protein [Methylotenera sp.]